MLFFFTFHSRFSPKDLDNNGLSDVSLEYKRDTFTILYLKIYDILLKINQVYIKNSAAVLPDMK
jgi:hypothetical protein